MKPRASLSRPLWIAAGLAAMALGLAGVALPVLPTTPFMLLAAFCFAKGSPRLHRWLVDHPRFGPAIRDWNRHGAISPKAKKLAAAAMAAALLISMAVGVPWTVLGLQALIMAGVAAFVLTRPSPPA
jgi:uncharacterized membrane protein YbaN (DUF454 family)